MREELIKITVQWKGIQCVYPQYEGQFTLNFFSLIRLIRKYSSKKIQMVKAKYFGVAF